MLKKAILLTRPTLAVISPARPESAKTDSSPWDAPCPKQGRSDRAKMILPSLLVYVVQDGPESPPLRASNEGLLRPRVARAQGTHRAVPPLFERAGENKMYRESFVDSPEGVSAFLPAGPQWVSAPSARSSNDLIGLSFIIGRRRVTHSRDHSRRRRI